MAKYCIICGAEHDGEGDLCENCQNLAHNAVEEDVDTDKKYELINELLVGYYDVIQKIYNSQDDDKSPGLYTRMIALQYFKNHHEDKMEIDEIIRAIEEWVLNDRTFIAYFWSHDLIGKSLESILSKYKPGEIGMNPDTICTALKQLELAKHSFE